MLMQNAYALQKSVWQHRTLPLLCTEGSMRSGCYIAALGQRRLELAIRNADTVCYHCACASWDTRYSYMTSACLRAG
jgi:hypothetical protein